MLSAGGVIVSQNIYNPTSLNFNLYYDGAKYITQLGNYQAVSANMREEFCGIELAGTLTGLNYAYAGINNMQATITRGISRR